ncbi:uncharacterized protein C8Q71DRAFT_854476 [Rhodofomes roseus]|uniref:FHA domain-containing protein n=1 Tax=Rhodofomes roseus TaxID=34475 RepID=A0ABQ8KQD6_9APHY|nr:uncharacterized protein C8Q71DRAFT_854476 [Rhodofomes roseus]KAH9840597.1 hypothetical protein C8Q71DRAFT_854476 [Rhodofomes roseus]
MDGGARTGSGNIFGVTLHVEAAGERPAETLTFLKVATRAVIIGRQSKQGRLEPESAVPRNALFLCPVVSRKHAKITFTEYGNAYVMDLRSHHGTHILRPGETLAKMLEPEIATVLADGDIITFGKSVGRDRDLVLPVVARVQLLFAPAAAALAPPLPERISISPDTAPSEQSPAPGTSGRYGIYVSSDSSASSSAGDSDIEEIPPPPPAVFSPSLRARTSQSSQASSLSGRLQLLRNLLPAAPSTCVDEPMPTAFTQLLALPISGAIDADSSSSESSSSSADSYARDDDDLYMEEPSIQPGHALFDEWHSLYEPPSPRPVGSFEVPRAHSTEVQPPSPVGADAEPFPGQLEIQNDRPMSPVPPVLLTALEDSIQTAREDISVLRQTRSTDEERFEEHVREMKARLAALDEAIRVPAQSAAERDAAVTNVVARMEALQGQMTALEHRAADVGPLEDGLKEIRAMLEEIKMIRENGERQVALELEAVRVARTQAEAAAAEAVARLAANPLKRKRSEDDDFYMDDDAGDVRVVVPMPKRRRMVGRVATMLARTATVATVGAVAAWTALAFA